MLCPFFVAFVLPGSLASAADGLLLAARTGRPCGGRQKFIMSLAAWRRWHPPPPPPPAPGALHSGTPSPDARPPRPALPRVIFTMAVSPFLLFSKASPPPRRPPSAGGETGFAAPREPGVAFGSQNARNSKTFARRLVRGASDFARRRRHQASARGPIFDVFTSGGG